MLCNGITDPGIYRDFGQNRSKTVTGLRDMMHSCPNRSRRCGSGSRSAKIAI
jgi:bacterioferritin-associated ferredoxin